MRTFHLISLGCAKNFVDSEVMLGGLTQGGWKFLEDAEEAEVLIVNTCGFIQPAVEEAIEEILELVRLKKSDPEKKIVVVGCLVQRYKHNLEEELPEVDLFIGTEGPALLAGILDQLVTGQLLDKVVLPGTFLMSNKTPRLLATPNFRGWLKITEGCDNRCSYCMIPSIRGDLRSRSSDDLVQEAIQLESLGIKELSLVAQDSTAYGNDCNTKSGRDVSRDLGTQENIIVLLEKLVKQTSIPWLRLLYLYPTGVSDALIYFLSQNSRVLPYLDIPFQHVNERVLHGMNRKYNQVILEELIDKLRKTIPDIALRTTFLVGFPGETEVEFLEIESFLRRYKLDHVGVFPYANEEGAPSEKLAGQLPEEEKQNRQDYLLKVQAEISEEVQQKYVGNVEEVLVEGVSSETDLLLEGRIKYQAPEVDGCVYINEGTASPGDLVQVKITEAKTYDLIGGIVD